MKLIGLSGSTRNQSYNYAILKYLQTQLPEGVTLEIVDYKDVPLFDADLDWRKIDIINEKRQQVANSDGIIMVTPEYNLSIPGPFKNFIDWLSLAEKNDRVNVLTKKKIVILGATTGTNQTIVAQEHLRQILNYMGAHVLSQPRVTISLVHQQMQDNLFIPNETTYKYLHQFQLAMLEYFE